MKSSNNIIHVAVATDDNYAHHLSVAIVSMLENMSKERSLHIYLLNEILLEKTKSKLEQLKTIGRFELSYINVSCKEYETYKAIVGLYISRLTYARFQLPTILGHLNKCLYIDCDVLVKQDIGKLWDIELPENAYLGAVEEPAARHRNKDLGIPERFSYFNAGVLMLNLEKLRTFHLEEKAFGFLKEKGSLMYADQDILNALFYDTWYALPLKWNVHSHVYILKDSNIYYRYSLEEANGVFNDVAIVHFSHERKPDSLISQSESRDDYWRYLKLTAWKHMLPKEINLVNLNLRFYWYVKRVIGRLPPLFIGLRTFKRFCTGYYYVNGRSKTD